MDLWPHERTRAQPHAGRQDTVKAGACRALRRIQRQCLTAVLRGELAPAGQPPERGRHRPCVARGGAASPNVQSCSPSCFGFISSNAGQNSFPLGYANRTVTQSFLAAHDLAHLEDAVPTLWKSGIYAYTSCTPVVWNGQVYLPSNAGSVDATNWGQVRTDEKQSSPSPTDHS